MLKRKLIPLALTLGLLLSCAACGETAGGTASPSSTPSASPSYAPAAGETSIVLSDGGVAVDGAAASTDAGSAVYVGAEIIYYEAGRDESYGAGVEVDGHTAGEAAAQTVVTITQPGTYRVSGTLSAGQLAVDLGEDAQSDPDAVVTLILDNMDITCAVAPAVIFYSVYECGSADTETAAAAVDTSAAGANVIIADGSVNHVDGSYVAKIYQEGTEKKLHKYDGAFYSKMSMNVQGEAADDGELYITAANEGLDSELHLTINGGNISITAQNDGINTNEDGVSVTTVNGGRLYINAGLGDEGDGIDSNGYLVINGGEIVTLANGRSGDGGLDADQGIYLNGGSVLALGSRNDAASTDSAQAYMELAFSSTLPAGSVVSITDAEGNELVSYTAEKEFATLTYTAPALRDDAVYHVYVDGVQQQFTGHSFGMGGGMMGGQEPPEGFEPGQEGERPDLPEGMEPPEDFKPGQQPDGTGMPRGTAPVDDGDRTPPGGAPDGSGRGGGRGDRGETLDPSAEFSLSAGSHSFSGVGDSTLG